MSKIYDGGPAFPRQALQVENREQWDYEELRGQNGMSVRAYFAGQAIDAAMNLCLAAVRGNPTSRAPKLREMAGVAVEIADALIAKLAEVPE